jgi:hypothetical protein
MLMVNLTGVSVSCERVYSHMTNFINLNLKEVPLEVIPLLFF